MSKITAAVLLEESEADEKAMKELTQFYCS